MYTTNIWNKLNLYSSKIILLFIVCTVISLSESMAQSPPAQVNNPRYDDRRVFTYGFSIGLHSSAYQLKYSDAFVTELDSVVAIYPKWSFGFSLGFIINARLNNFIDARLTPKVGFYENKLEFVFTGNTDPLIVVDEATIVELPLLLKFKSARRKNTRVYFITGINPGIEASGKSDLEEDQERLQIDRFNLLFELGIGIDKYFPLFKFSPEIRYSLGLNNVLSSTKNDVSLGIDHLNTHVFTFYFHFQ